jgi:hypothetical protein
MSPSALSAVIFSASHIDSLEKLVALLAVLGFLFICQRR